MDIDNIPKDVLWFIDSGYGCGGVITRDRKIIETAPIFKRFIGRNISSIPYKWKKIKLEE